MDISTCCFKNSFNVFVLPFSLIVRLLPKKLSTSTSLNFDIFEYRENKNRGKFSFLRNRENKNSEKIQYFKSRN